MASNEKLIIELDAKVGTLTAELDKVNKKLDETESNTDGADNALKSFASSAKTVAAATAGAVAAFTAFVTITAKSRAELQNLASQANLATGEFEALAFATETYGITAEQIADISKDLSDKIGEFATVGTGAFQDVADVLGLTSEQAQEFAQSLTGLTSQEVIQEISNQLESVNANAEQTTFVFESLGNDLSRLTPLFAQNGKELETLTDRYNQANAALEITAQQEQELRELSTTFSLLTDQLGNAATKITATVAPAFDSFFNAVIDVVPDATNTIVDFFNKFREAASLSSIEEVQRQIDDLTQSNTEAAEELERIYTGQRTFLTDAAAEIRTSGLESRIESNIERLSELQNRQEELINNQTKLAEIEGRQGGSISGSFGGDADSNQAQIDAIAARFLTEEELLREKLNKELEIVGENQELRKALEEEYNNELLALQTERLDEELSLEKAAADRIEDLRKADIKAEQKAQSDKLAYAQTYTGAALTLANTFFEDNKALRAGLVVVDTAAGIAKAFADLPYPAALAASASIAATGAAQLAAINSATKGTGSVTTTSTGTSEVTNDLIDDLGDSSDLTVSAGDTSGANQQIVLKIEADDSDVANSISALLSNAKLTGTLQ